MSRRGRLPADCKENIWHLFGNLCDNYSPGPAVRRHLAIVAACAGALLSGTARSQVYDPNVSVSTSLTSVAQSATVNLLDLGTSGTNGLISNQSVSFGSGDTAGTISYTGTSGIYSGNVTGVAAAPFTATGPTTGNYFSAQPNSAITITYAQQQQYFGMMWGSVDTSTRCPSTRATPWSSQCPARRLPIFRMARGAPATPTG